jgi:hypothetical protein
MLQALDNGIDAAVLSSVQVGTEKNYRQQHRDFVACCHLASESPFPYNYLAIARYLFLCFLASPTFCANTLGPRVSDLRWVAQVDMRSWIRNVEQARLTRLIAGLKKLSPHFVTQAIALIIAIIEALVNLSSPIQSLQDLQWYARALMAHAGMWRMDDHTCDKMAKDHVNFASNGTIVWIAPGKTNLLFEPTVFREDGETERLARLNAALVFKDYWRAASMKARPGSSKVWPNIDRFGKTNWNKGYSDEAFIKDTKFRATKAGLKPEIIARITGHSFRAGGATDYLLAGVPAIWVKLQGRWKSDAYLIYLRLSQTGLLAMAGKLFQGLAALLGTESGLIHNLGFIHDETNNVSRSTPAQRACLSRRLFHAGR